MALLDEEIVEYWLNTKGFFCMRGIKHGNSEIDFLAIRPNKEGIECWHVEVTVSFNPVGYIGGTNNAKRRDDKGIEDGVDDYIRKKFTLDKKTQKRDEILPNSDWKYVLVCAVLREENKVVELFENKGITVYRYKAIVDHLKKSSNQEVNSTAGNIIQILRYFDKD